MKISKELYTFFKEWLDWASSAGVEDTRIFSKDEGLCTSLTNWSNWNKCDTVLLHSALVSLLEVKFNGNYQFPFDKNLKTYWEAKRKATHYKNPQRLAFVREQVDKYEKCDNS